MDFTINIKRKDLIEMIEKFGYVRSNKSNCYKHKKIDSFIMLAPAARKSLVHQFGVSTTITQIYYHGAATKKQIENHIRKLVKDGKITLNVSVR